MMLLWVVLSLSVEAQSVFISTKLGRFQGNVHSLNDGSNVYEFIGIPYAKPPLGDLRFAPSQLNETYGNGTYNATQFGPACLQPYGFLQIENSISENCLFLNIWTPTINKTANIPVMIWIHGGGDQYGSGSDATYHGNNCGNVLNPNCMAIGEKVVLVSMNYRLGVFGFLSNTDLFKQYGTHGGLNGLGDQITAINWVYKYISDYGGNPDDLTIFGESAGGTATCMLMISPAVKKQPFKLKGAVIHSGACNGPWAPATTQLGVTFSNNALTSNGYSTNIDALREQITNATEFLLTVGPILASVDGYILTDLPVNVYNSSDLKQQLNVETAVVGFNSMDGLAGWPWLEPWDVKKTPETNDEYKIWLDLYFVNKTQSDLMYNYYYPPSNFPSYSFHVNASIAWYTIVSDACLTCPSLTLADNIVDNAAVESYVYLFGGTKYPFYAGHGSELAFVFDYDDAEANAIFEIPWNQSLSNSMVSAWSNYGRYGLPNITNVINKVNIEWKPYGTDKNVMVFKGEPVVQSNFPSNYRNKVCDFWANEVGSVTQELVCFNVL